MAIKVHFKIAIAKMFFICNFINFDNGPNNNESSDLILKDKIVF